MKNKKALFVAVALACCAAPSWAADDGTGRTTFKDRFALSKKIKETKETLKQLPMPVPSGLFGIFAFPNKGQGAAGINAQRHAFEGLLQGSDSISAETIASTVPNHFAGAPGQPNTLRVIPLEAKADVVFPFANFAINEHVALVGLAPLVKKKSLMQTFSGGADPSVSLGTFEVESEGLGDIKFGALYRAFSDNEHKHNFTIDAVLSAPTGDITVEDDQLSPAGAMTKARLAYGMQLGSGTWDALLGVAYWGKEDKWGWGGQYLATLPLESKNSEGWRFGDKHELTGWASYQWKPDLVSSLRLRGETQDKIHGLDSQIYGPGLGADPDNYGGERLELGLGANWMPAPGHNLGAELMVPVYQDRNGVQSDHAYSLMLSWRMAFL